LVGIAGFLTGRLTGGSIVPSVQAADDEPLMIGKENSGNKRTTLNADVPEDPFNRGITLYARNLATTGATTAVAGYVYSTDAHAEAVHGNAEAGVGVAGYSSSPDGYGVQGVVNSPSGMCKGVVGRSYSPDGTGVEGSNDETSGSARGVAGYSNSPDGAGVDGKANANSGWARGVLGFSNSPDGAGVEGRSFGTGVVGYALAAGAIPMVAKGFAGQTANLQEWRNDDEKPLAFIDKNGNLGIGNLRITRDGNNFAFLNSKGDAIAVLDSKGNLRLKGKLKENVL
jgi:hypothetical protein